MSYCFCTLALGSGYTTLAAQLAGDLQRYAPGTRIVVLTDHPQLLESCSNVDAIYHRQRSTLGYNDKLSVVSRALDSFDTAIFIDADSRVLAPVQLDAEMFRPGLRAWLIRKWAYMQDIYDKSPQAPQWQKDDLRIMRLLKDRCAIGEDERETPFVVECLFSITRDGTAETEKFLKRWNSLAEFCERQQFYRHEGYALGLAAKLQGFPIEQNRFGGIRFFEPLKSLRFDVPNGVMSKVEYDDLASTINRYKGSTPQPVTQFGRVMRRARRLKIKWYGLNLIY